MHRYAGSPSPATFAGGGARCLVAATFLCLCCVLVVSHVARAHALVCRRRGRPSAACCLVPTNAVRSCPIHVPCPISTCTWRFILHQQQCCKLPRCKQQIAPCTARDGRLQWLEALRLARGNELGQGSTSSSSGLYRRGVRGGLGTPAGIRVSAVSAPSPAHRVRYGGAVRECAPHTEACRPLTCPPWGQPLQAIRTY